MAGLGAGLPAHSVPGAPAAIATLAGAALIVWLAPNTQQILRDHAPAFEIYEGEIREWTRRWPRWQPTLGWATAMVAVLLLAVNGLRKPTEFLYFQF